MADLVVVVPGITGSELHRPDGTIVWRKSLVTAVRGIARLPTVLDSLALPAGIGDAAPDEPHRLVAPGLIGGWHIWPGIHTGDGYHRLAQLIKRAAPGATRLFPYDWRLSIRHTARLLDRAIDRWLTEWHAASGDPRAKVRFVCHSMGGLVVRYWLEVLGGRAVTSRVVTLGTPYSGSVKAVRALTGDAFARMPYGDRITRAARSFPALAQLLPSYRCHQTPDGPAGLADRTVPGLDTALIADGLRLHAELAAAVAANGKPDYDLHVVTGTRNGTTQSFTTDARGIRYLNTQRGVRHLGDGTVPLFAAVPPEWPDTSAAEVLAVRHAAMGVTESVLDTVWNKLAAVPLAATLAPPIELGLTVPDTATEADGIDIVAHSNQSDVRLAAELRDPDTDAIVADADVPSRGDGEYAATLPAPAGLWRIVVRTVAERPEISVGDMIFVA